MKLNQLKWKELTVLLLITIFLFSGIQSANFGANTSGSSVSHHLSPAIEKQVQSVSGAGSVKLQAPVTNMIPNVKGYYTVSFSQTGLNPGLSWGVYILNNSIKEFMTSVFQSYYNYTSNNYTNANTPHLSEFTAYGFSNGNNLNFSLKNGSYFFFLTVMNSTYFSSLNSSMTSMPFTIQGSSLSVSIQFPAMKKVDINALGLHSGSKWTISMCLLPTGMAAYYNSSFSNSMIAYLPLGNYSYSYTEGINIITTPDPSNIVVTSTNTTFSIHMVELVPVTFTENGLTAGFDWKLKVFGGGLGSIYYNVTEVSSFTLELSNGTYYYSAYTGATEQFSQLTVNTSIQSSYTVSIMLPILYKFTFNENGLASGMNWGIIVQGTTNSIDVCYLNGSDSTSLNTYLPNGTFQFTPVIGSIALGYSSSVTGIKGTIFTSASLLVAGSGSHTITFPSVQKINVNINGIFPGLNYNVAVKNTTAGSQIYGNYSSNASFVMFLPSGPYNIYVNSSYNLINEYFSKSFNITTYGFTINVTVPIYKVNVKATGLLSGMYKEFTFTGPVNGLSHSSNSTFYLINGTYSYSFYVGSTPGGLPKTSFYNEVSSEFNVTGSTVNVSIHFPQYYRFFLNESEITSGNDWAFQLTTPGGTSEIFNETTIPQQMVVFLNNGTYDYSFGAFNSTSNAIISPMPGTFTVSSNSPQIITLKIVARYTVTFVETGLSSFTLWSIDLLGVTNSSMTSSISFVEFNGTYNYSVLPVTGYSSSKSNGTVTVNQNNVTVNIVFTSLTPPKQEYTVYFNETGLQSGTTWEVVMNGTSLASTTNSILCHEPNGSYAFYVVPVSGYENSPLDGNVTVSGQSTTINVTFTAISTQPPVWAFVGAYAEYNITSIYKGVFQSYNVKFTVSSVNKSNDTVQLTLTSSNPKILTSVMYQNWNQFGVWLGKSQISELNNASTNGFKNVTTNVKVTTPAGTFLTDQFNISSSNVTLSIYFDMYSGIFVKESMKNSTGSLSASMMSTNIPQGNSTVSNYSVIFTESGLPSGTAWYVNLSNGNKSGAITGSTYTFTLVNGTYSYNIATTNKTLHANAGSITVNGKNISKPINFSKFTYTVTFTESGLSSGTHWNMTFNGSPSSSTGTTITFHMSNGTYSYTVSNVSGYSITSASGSITVNGANAAKNVIFTSSSPPSSSPSPAPNGGISQMELYAIAGVVVAIIAALGVVMFLRRK